VVTFQGARLSHLFVHVRDLAAARRFYVEKLGLALLMEELGYIRVGGGEGFHIGMEEVPDEIGAPGIEIAVAVHDVDETFARLRDEGIEFESEPQDMPWGARHAWLRDPSGYRLSIYSGASGAD
jgi:catechol 2,3-dioxygenase-like lactoylglutathione lyase family enzyme